MPVNSPPPERVIDLALTGGFTIGDLSSPPIDQTCSFKFFANSYRADTVVKGTVR